MKKIEKLIYALEDRRGKEVVFVSHCLLNVNTRYLGGAFRKGSVTEIIEDMMAMGVGIVQMKCPEQYAWGGVLKKYLWIAIDTKGTIIHFIKPLLLKIFLVYTRSIYKRVARETVYMIRDYYKSGYKVLGMIGIDGSPSCGVTARLDMKEAFDFFANQKIDHIEVNKFNTELYAKCTAKGKGIYFEEIVKKLKSLNIDVPIYGHSLIAEMRDEKSKITYKGD
jgi:predicted secreted protein